MDDVSLTSIIRSDDVRGPLERAETALWAADLHGAMGEVASAFTVSLRRFEGRPRASTYPVAYHLYNACEATANSVDAWAVGISVAVEAVASLVVLRAGRKKAAQITSIRTAMQKWLSGQSFPKNHKGRVAGLIDMLGNKRPQDTMYALAETGHAEKTYIKAWQNLRNRHVHPKLKDLEKPSPKDYQKLIDDIHRTEVLLRQLTFFLIGYEGPFTGYGVHGAQAFPSKQYPLKLTTVDKMDA